ncbi:MAG: hypothetical protein WC540_10320 [Sulfuritalea sp.]
MGGKGLTVCEQFGRRMRSVAKNRAMAADQPNQLFLIEILRSSGSAACNGMLRAKQLAEAITALQERNASGLPR